MKGVTNFIYKSDPSTFIIPANRKTGQLQSWAIADFYAGLEAHRKKHSLWADYDDDIDTALPERLIRDLVSTLEESDIESSLITAHTWTLLQLVQANVINIEEVPKTLNRFLKEGVDVDLSRWFGSLAAHLQGEPIWPLFLDHLWEELPHLDRELFLNHFLLLLPLIRPETPFGPLENPFTKLRAFMPPLFCEAPKEPDLLQIDLAELKSFEDEKILREEMDKHHELFQSLSEDDKERVALRLSETAQAPDTAQNLSLLYTLVKSPQYRPDFWNHPLFSHPLADDYIFLAHALGLFTKQEVATLHTMAFTLYEYKREGIPILSFPLFLEDGSPHPSAWEMLGKTTGMENDQRRTAWFEAMRQEGALQQHFLFTFHREEEALTVMQRIVSREVNVNILFNSTKSPGRHFIPSIQAALLALKAVGGKYLPTPIYHYGLGIPSDMREEQNKRCRTVTLQTKFFPAPFMADDFSAPAAELTLHDLLYHFYTLSFIPPLHLDFWMEWSEHLEKELEKLDEPLQEYFREFIFIIIDAEFPPYESFSASKDILHRAFETLLSRIATFPLTPGQQETFKFLATRSLIEFSKKCLHENDDIGHELFKENLSNLVSSLSNESRKQ